MSRLYPRIARLMAGSLRRSAAARYIFALVLPLVALLLTIQIPGIATAPFFSLFTLSVLLASLYGGTGPGLITTALCVVLNAGVVIEPRWSLSVADPNQLVRLVIFAAVGACISVLTGIIAEVQTKLDNERQRLKVTLSSIGDAVIATDSEGRITFLNPVAEQVTGWNLSDVAGQKLETVFRILNEQTRARADDPVRKVLESGAIVGLANHTVLVRKDGTEIPIDDSAAPIRDLSGGIVGVVLVFRDISDRRRTELALLKSEKLASVGRLAATIAHEINNPLEAVSNLLFLVSATPELPSHARSYLDLAREQLERAAHVSKQTLAFYRPAQTRESARLSDIVEGVFSLYESRLAGKQARTKKKYRECPAAEVASSEIRQVITNLLSNAIDAMKERGTLQVRLGSAYVQERQMVCLTVADDGVGIAADDLPKIFEPFFTTKEHVGTGLGLWISSQIVEAHGGSIRVRSRLGRGTVVRVQLPALAAAAVAASETSAEQPGASEP